MMIDYSVRYHRPSRQPARLSATVWALLVFLSFLVTLIGCGLGLVQLSSSFKMMHATASAHPAVLTKMTYNDKRKERQLFSLVTRQCSLSTNMVEFRYNASSGLYSSYTQYNSYEGGGGRRHERALEHAAMDHGFFQTDGAIVQVRACWCTEVFFQRPMEYCPAEYDTCIVRGSTGPVQCFQASGGHSFIRSFWPVLLFWLVALLYALMCSEPGGSARDFVRRQVLTCCLCRSARGDQILDRDLTNLLERQPERAAFLYRSVMLRARRRRLHHGGCRWWKCWQVLRRRNNSNDGATRQRSSGDDMYDLYLQARYDTLTLKTRVFSEHDEESSQQRPRSPSEGALEASSSTLNSPSRSSNNETARSGGISWIPAQFRREQVTLEEMDDEMEQGIRCAICLTRLVQGDVVGDIPCRHVFHKDCLKSWLRRSNRCPLCQQQGVARLSPCTREVLDRLEEEDANSDSNSSVSS